MIVTLQLERLRTIEQLKAFVAGSAPVDCKPLDRASVYDFVRRTLVAFDYHRLGKADRGCVRRYVVKVTALSAAQLTRLVARHAETGAVVDLRARNSGRAFETRYGRIDIRLLAEIDEAFGQMSGLATCEILRRALEVHGDPRFERLAGISRSHVYNLRGSRTYRTKRTTWTKTKGSNVAIAVRKAPEPNGVPGFLRVDTVHQGDRDGVKGVYIVNLVDEVTQYEYVGVVRGISERFLIPALEALLLMFPFPILGFHADNGSEYINHRVVGLLQKLHVGEFTKSRARRSNDNALVEGKNAHVVRRHLGHEHIPARFADDVDAFAREHLSPFVNFHRPSLYATEYVDSKGKVRRKYLRDDVKTPYEKLKSLSGATGHLKPGLTFGALDRIAGAQSDLEAARALNAARAELFRRIRSTAAAA